MAWRSSGINNDEMVNNLKRYGVIHSSAVEEGFKAVDRRFFVPQNHQDVAHTDQPLKEGNLHISAPHIYGTVVEALDLHPQSSLSFLNLGCGTGYLSSIVAHILGPTSSHVGIDIHADVVEHCRASLQRWKQGMPTHNSIPPMDVLHGNVLHIDDTQGEAKLGFDRIYIGASLAKAKLAGVAGLLRPGGILVGPVDDELVKVIRIGSSNRLASGLPGLPRSFRGQAPPLSEDFSHQVLSAVRFAPLVSSPVMRTVIPSRVWSPSIHRHYPDSFRRCCKEILLCASSPESQPTQPSPPAPAPVKLVNVASSLPRALWMEILSYTHRDWFEPPPSEVEFLRRRLAEERAAAQRAQEARMEAESRLHMVERERDVYRLLALRWQTRLLAARGDNGNQDAVDDDDEDLVGMEDLAEVASGVLREPLILRLGGWSAVVRPLPQDSEDDDDDDEDEELGDEENDDGYMDEESEASSDDMDTMEHSESEAMHISGDSMMGRPLRSVSITSHDLSSK